MMMATAKATNDAADITVTQNTTISTPEVEAKPRGWLASQQYAGYLARGFWLVCLLLSIYVFINTNPSRLRQIQDAYTLNSVALDQIGFSRQLLPSYIVALDTTVFFVYALVGMLIFWRKSSDWVALFGSLALVTAGFTIARPADSLFFVNPQMRLPLLVLFILGTGSILVFLYIFPNGKFSPKWMGWVALVASGLPVSVYLQQLLSIRTMPWPPPAIAVTTIPAILLAVAAQVYRYRHTASRSQRQQTKWVVYGLCLGTAGMLGFQLLVPVLIPEVRQIGMIRAFYIVIGVPLFYLTLMMLPLSIAMSVLRYKLWDIDLIIRRTLLYGAMTAAIAGLFAAAITFTQKLFLSLTGQQSDLAAVIATLLVVAAYTPIKDYMQKSIDRRLNLGPSPANRLHALIEHVNARVSPVEPYQISRRLVDESVAAFNAMGGAVYWEVNSKPRMIYSTGVGGDDEMVSVSLQSTAQTPRIGFMNLAARRDGTAYTDEDREVLQQAATAIGLAIEQDGSHG